jgi:hypothetical protein
MKEIIALQRAQTPTIKHKKKKYLAFISFLFFDIENWTIFSNRKQKIPHILVK